MRAFVALALAAMPSACSDRTSTGDESAAAVSVTPTPSDAPALQCRARPEGEVLTQFGAGTCGAALVQGEGGVVLQSLSPDDPDTPAQGAQPEACDPKASPCTFLGYDSALGPVVLAVVEQPRSEMPAGVWLGAALDGSRSRLAFIDLWAGAGDSVTGDATDLGPAFSLAPFACGDALGLFAVGRLAAAVDTEPPPELVAREGIYAWASDGPQRSDADRGACRPIDVELP